MLRLKATKRQLYKLVAEYEDLPPTTKTEFRKAYRSSSYWLRWRSDGLWCKAFLCVCGGRPLLEIKKDDYDVPKEVSRVVLKMDLEDLRERGMVEDFITAAERAARERMEMQCVT